MFSSRPVAWRRRWPGFTLIELLFTLLVAAILLTTTGPAFMDMVRESRLSSEINLLLADIHLARMAAIKRNEDVVLCRSADASGCDESDGPEADWSDGWIAYVNPDGDKERDPGERLLLARGRLPAGMSLRFNQWWRVVFRSDGGARSGTFTLCDSRGGMHGRALTLYYTGRPRIAATRADGGPLSCAESSA